MADTEVAPAAVENLEKVKGSPEKSLPSEETKPAPVAAETEEDVRDQKIIRQLEYYFGDANLPNDKFIKAESAKNEGWFPLSALLTFNRIQTLLSDVPQDDRINRIVKALRASVLIDIDEKAEKIRRNLEVPLPEGNSYDRTVYIKGFHKTDTRLDDLIDFYSKFDGMSAVIMRWYKEKVILPGKANGEGEGEKDSQNGNSLAELANVGFVKKFKGSILVIFKTVELAEQFLKEEKHSYGGANLTRMRQKDYRDMKKAEFEERQALRTGRKPDGEKGAATEEKEEEVSDLPKGALIKINEVPAGFSRETLKEKFYSLAKEEDFPIAFVDFQRGDTTAILRLEAAGSAEEAMKLIPDSKLPVGTDAFCQCELFTAEDEKAYFLKIRDNRMRLKRRGGSGGNRGYGGRGRGGGRGRQRGGHGGKRGGGRRN